MKKKNSTRENVNLFFSAFLIIAYIICAFFFVSFTNQQSNQILQSTLLSLILVVFGLLVFYATRVGEGAVVKRFSLVTLIVLDLPTLLIVLAYIIPAFPLHDVIAGNEIMAYLAGAALGYGIPYTFISGFEIASEDETTEEEVEESAEVIDGGVEADVLEALDNEEAVEEPEQEEETDEIVVEGTAVIEDVEAYVAQQKDENTEETQE
jgi:membrane-associated HD superfamily phosphohydrolase